MTTENNHNQARMQIREEILTTLAVLGGAYKTVRPVDVLGSFYGSSSFEAIQEKYGLHLPLGDSFFPEARALIIDGKIIEDDKGWKLHN